MNNPKPGRLGTDLHRDWIARAVRQYGVEPAQHVSLDYFWSALRLRPALDSEPDAFTGDIAWPSSPIA